MLVADGERWTFARQPGGGGNVFVFVVGLVAFLLIGNGAVMIASHVVAGVVMLAVGAGLAALAVVFIRRRAGTRTTSPLQPIVVLDLAGGWLLAASGQPIAPLADVQFRKEMQLASSARMLVCTWPPQGRVVVLRGDAFGGSIGPAIDALRSRGLRVS